jgi:hypothetical protein
LPVWATDKRPLIGCHATTDACHSALLALPGPLLVLIALMVSW